MLNRFLCCILLLGIVETSALSSQHVRVVQYDYSEQKSGMQNWDVKLDTSSILYSANTEGLLRYNGLDWQLLMPNSERMVCRAVLPIRDTIYVAGDRFIGYWLQAANGQFEYHSLLPLVRDIHREGESYWSIQELNGNIFFQSFNGIICYDGNTMYDVLRGKGCYPLIKTKDELFSSSFSNILLKVEQNGITEIQLKPTLDSEFRFIFKLSDSSYFAGTSDGKIYTFTMDGRCTYRYTIKSAKGKNVKIECGALNDSQIAIGTIGDGLVLLDIPSGTWSFINNQLQDLNIHSIAYGDSKTLWLAMDRGIATVHLNASEWMVEMPNNFGVFFDVIEHNQQLFFASNRGLFTSSSKCQTPFFPLQFAKIKNQLLCGAVDKLYIFNDYSNQFVPYTTDLLNGVQQFEYVQNNQGEFVVLRGYSGISTLKWTKNKWEYNSHIKNISCHRELVVDHNTIWTVNEQYGLLHMKLSDDFSSCITCDTFPSVGEYVIGSQFWMAKCDENILFVTPTGIYLYDDVSQSFIIQDQLCQSIADLPNILQVKTCDSNRLWFIYRDKLLLYKIRDKVASLQCYKSFVHNNIVWYDGHCNLRTLNDSLVYVSTMQGTFGFLLNEPTCLENKSQPISIESVSYTDKNVTHYVKSGYPIRLPYSASNIRIALKRPSSDVNKQYISYVLSDTPTNWSDWQASGVIAFDKMPEGDYKLWVRVSANPLEAMSSFSFQIAPPWYRSWWGWLIWSVMFLIVLTIFGLWMSRHITYRELRKKHAEQEKDFRESMRRLVHKQEVLDAVMEELEKQQNENGMTSKELGNHLSQIIIKGNSEQDKILTYENYFVDSQHEFMLRMHKLYPNLTAAELRFACLLRANLATKEIAEILNVTPHSIELRRYRLKQHIGLGKDDSLSTIIFSI